MASFNLTAGADSLLGGDDEADTFSGTALALSAADTIIGGDGGIDALVLTGGGTLAAAAFAATSGIEAIQLDDAGYAITLATGALGAEDGVLLVTGGNGADTVGASFFGQLDRLHFVALGGAGDSVLGGAGDDLFEILGGGSHTIGGNTGNDTVVIAASLLDGQDSLIGASGNDRLEIEGAGAITAAQLARIVGFEEIALGDSITGITVNATMRSGLTEFTVLGAATGQRVDTRALLSNQSTTYLGGGGNDSMQGGAGVDIFEVSGAARGNLGDGSDVLRLVGEGAKLALVKGGAGDDRIELATGGTWDLRAFYDFEEVALEEAARVTLPGAIGARAFGSAGHDRFRLSANNQVVHGGAGDDTVVGTTSQVGTAVLTGDGFAGGLPAGRDTLIVIAEGASFNLNFVGLFGFERLVWRNTTGNPNVLTLNAAPLEVVLEGAADLRLGANALQSAYGSTVKDLFTLGAVGQFVDAGAGDDFVTGTLAQLQGASLLLGGSGNDRLTIVDIPAASDLGTILASIPAFQFEVTGWVNAVTDLALGSRRVEGGNSNDRVLASPDSTAFPTGSLGGGADTIILNDTTEVSSSASGALSGGSGTDMLRLEVSGSFFNLQLSSRFVDFEIVDLTGSATSRSFNMSLLPAFGYEVRLGGDQTVTGGAGSERFLLATGDGAVFGGDGADSILGNTGRDSLQGGNGADSLVGADGNDTLIGQAGNDTVRGGAGNDSISQNTVGSTGADGADSLSGDAGADTIVAGAGAQTLDGGADTDRLLLGLLQGSSLVFTSQTTAIVTAGVNTLTAIGFEIISAGIDPVSLNASLRDGANAVTLDGGSGADTLLGGAASDRLDGGSGADRLAGGNGADTLVAGLGADTLDGQGGTDHALLTTNDGSGVVATLDALGNGTAVRGGQTAMLASIEVLLGGFGNDSLTGNAQAETLSGGGGNDTLRGEANTDSLAGGSGNDELRGGDGADSILAGEGADSLWGDAGGDRIDLTETTAAADRIAYNSTSNGTADIDVSQAQSGADLIIGLGTVDVIVFSQAGLGLTSGLTTVKLAENATWNAAANSIFIVHQNDRVNDDGAFGDFAKVSAAVNIGAGAKSGFVANRGVVFAVTGVDDTGVYLWKDLDGDGSLDSTDTLHLLAIVDGVTTATLAADDLLPG